MHGASALSLLRTLLLSTLMLCLLPARAWAAFDLAGTWSDTKLTLTLKPDANKPDTFHGSITFNGKVMKVIAFADPLKGMFGKFESDGHEFPFDLQEGKGSLLLSTGGKTYVLLKVPVERPPLNQNPPPPNPIPPVPIGEMPPPVAPTPHGAVGAPRELPAFLKVGTRITYHEGSSTVGGAYLAPASGGAFSANGQTYNLAGNRSSGGVGYAQFTIVHAKPEYIAADVRGFLCIDVAKDIVIASANGAKFGNGNALGEHWRHPATLAELREGKQADGSKVSREIMKLGGRDYKAITLTYLSKNVFNSHRYDTETGLLLSSSSVVYHDGVQIVDDQGNLVQNLRGTANYSHSLLADVRTPIVPWANEPPPAWAAKGRRLEYQLSSGVDLAPHNVAGVPQLPPLPPKVMPLAYEFGDAVGTCIVANGMTVEDSGVAGIPPNENKWTRCFGSAVFGGLWVSPKSLRDLRPNQVLDEDKVTKFRTIYVGQQGNVATILEQGPCDNMEYHYDLQSGMLVSLRSIQQTNPEIGGKRIEMRLVGQR